MLRHVNVTGRFWKKVGDRWVFGIPWKGCRVYERLAEVRPTNDGRYAWFRVRCKRLEPEFARTGPVQGVCRDLDLAKEKATEDLQKPFVNAMSEEAIAKLDQLQAGA